MKKFLSYLIPSLIASVLMSMYAIVDGIFIGQKIGDSGLAAVNIGWPITSFLQSIGTALGLAGGIYSQGYIAKNEIKKAKEIKSLTLFIVAILAIVLGLGIYLIRKPLLMLLGAKDLSLTYAMQYLEIILAGSLFQMLGQAFLPLLKNSNKVKIASIASICAIATNFTLDYVLMYPCNMNLEGAALASIIAQAVAMLICFFAYIKELVKFKFDINILKNLLKIAVAPFILTFSYATIIMITNLFCSHYGQDEAVAAYTLLSYISYIILAIGCAVGDSIQPLFSYNHSLKQYKHNNFMLKMCYLISSVLCILVIILVYLFKVELGNLYNLSSEAFKIYSSGLKYYALATVFVAFIKVTSSYFYAIDAKINANVVIIVEPFILTPLFLFTLTAFFKLNGIWIAYLVIQCIIFILSLILIIFNQKNISKYI